MILQRLYRYYKKKKLHSLAKCLIGIDSAIDYLGIHAKEGVHLIIGHSSIVEASIFFDRENSYVSIGDRTFIGRSTIVCADKVEIGNDVLISWGCTIVDHNSHSIDWSSRKSDVIDWARGEKSWSGVKVMPVKISDRVWIGFNAIILKGVTIGQGAIVGAGSVVTRDVPPYTIVAGNPARIVREIPLDER